MEPIFSTSFEIKEKLGLPTVERKSAPIMKRHGGSSGWNGKVYGSTAPPQSDVITWNIGPQGVDLSFPLIAQTLSKGAAVVMFQEVSILSPGGKKEGERHPEDDWLRLLVRHRIKSTCTSGTGGLQSRSFDEKL